MAPSANPPSSSSSTVDENPSRILVPEKLSPDGLALLTNAGFTVDNRPGGLSADELLNLIPSYHALVVRSETKVTAQVLSAGSKLRVVARAGVYVLHSIFSSLTTSIWLGKMQRGTSWPAS